MCVPVGWASLQPLFNQDQPSDAPLKHLRQEPAPKGVNWLSVLQGTYVASQGPHSSPERAPECGEYWAHAEGSSSAETATAEQFRERLSVIRMFR